MKGSTMYYTACNLSEVLKHLPLFKYAMDTKPPPETVWRRSSSIVSSEISRLLK